MGESAPSSPGRESPTPGTSHPPPTVYTPLVSRLGYHGDEEDDDDGVRQPDVTAVEYGEAGPSGAADHDDHFMGLKDDDAACREPASPTARTPLVPAIEEPEPEPASEAELEMTLEATQGTPVLGVHRPPPFMELGYPPYLESGPPLPILLTPLAGTKSETCSYILPPTAGCSSGFDTKSETNSVLVPLCRICHMSEDDGEPLISPCRCSGTLQHIHNTCLMRWLEILSKKSRKPPKCELCHFQYHRHKKFKFHHWRFPRVSRQDKILHIIFIVNLVMMIGCAVATVMSFLSDESSLSQTPPGNNVELSTEEIITLSCGVLFFVSFFIAMSVQIKAKHTIYQLFIKFIMQNMEWEIDEYDKSKDSLYKDLYKGLPVYV